MEIYNKYIKHPHKSKIAFIKTLSGVISKTIFYVEFKDLKTGMYLDKGNRLNELYKFKHFVESEGDITKIQRFYKYYTFIKVIKDDNNPGIEGETMIFYFGRQILLNIRKYPLKYTENIFNLKSNLLQRFPDFSESKFSSKKMVLKDNSLNIESFVNIPVLDLEAIERKKNRRKKLEYIQKKTNLKDNLLSILEKKDDNEIKVEEIINLVKK